MTNQIENSVVNHIWSFEVIQWISLSSGFTMRSGSAILQGGRYSQHRIKWPETAHACQQSCLSPLMPLLIQQTSFEQVSWLLCFWDLLPCFWRPAIVVAHDVGIIYWKPCVQEVSPDGFCATIAQMPAADQHLTIWMSLVRLNSGAPENATIWR